MTTTTGITKLEQTKDEFILRFGHQDHISSQTPLLARESGYWCVHEIMTAKVISVEVSTTLPEIRRILQEHGFRHLLVKNHDRIVGIITDRDIRRALPSDATSLAQWEIPLLLEKTTAKELMHNPVITILQDAPVAYAARVMLEENISCLVVLYGDELKGIVTTSDILRAVAQS